VLYLSKAPVCLVTCILVLFSIVSYCEYAAAQSNQAEMRGSKAILRPGNTMKVTIASDKPTTMNNLSFSAKRLGLTDPFSSSQIPFTVEVYESDKLVASETFTWSLGDKFEKINWVINNAPKLDERYKMLIRYDIAEDNTQQSPIQIDTERIDINEGNDGIEVHGRIKIVFSTS
jgi:hypothetical protein